MKVAAKGEQIALFGLLLACLALLYYVWRPILEQHPQAVAGQQQAHTFTQATLKNREAIARDEIVSVELLDVNFWEARFKVAYRHKAGRRNGYLQVTGDRWTPNAGLMTRSGAGAGITILSRRSGRPKAYTDQQVRAIMYDPVKRDENVVEQFFPIKIQWPDSSTIEPAKNASTVQFSRIGGISIYRNVPRYVDFAKRLTELGFPAHRLNMMLAVCRGCPGSLIYGADVDREQLQSVLQALKEFNFPLAKVSYSDKAKHEGEILIGASPLQDSKPLWANIETLLDPEIDDTRFFATLGFPILSPRERAEWLVRRGKDLLDGDRNSSKAKELLDRALEADSSYVPAYLQLARHVIRSANLREYDMSDNAKRTAAKSVSIVKSAIKIDPDYADSYVMLGYSLIYAGEYQAAKAALDTAEKLQTKDLWLHYNRALMYKYTGERDKSIESLERVLGVATDGSDNDRALMYSLYRLAELYREDQRIDDAFGVYSALRKYFPNYDYGYVAYMKMAVANDRDRDEVKRMLEGCRSCSKSSRRHISGMLTLIEASQAETSKAFALLARSQAVVNDNVAVVADLLRGQAGRDFMATLFKRELLNMKDLEQEGSLLLALADDYEYESFNAALRLGADPNYLDQDLGYSPLIWAVISHDSDLVDRLIRHGGDPDLENSQGYSARSLAESMNLTDIVRRMSGKGMNGNGQGI